MKTLNIFRVLLLLLAVNCFALPSFAQTTLCPGDSVCLDAGSFRGTIQWQQSSDNINFTDINGATMSPYCAVPPAGYHYLRGYILEGTCDTLFTDTLEAYVVSPIVITLPVDEILITACGNTATIGDSVSVSGGDGPYTYLWTPGTDLDSVDIANPMFTANSAGIFTYTVNVTDTNGCSAAASPVNVNVDPQGITTFNFTGGMQTFTVPACVDTIFIQTWGGQGGSGATGGSSTAGGAGGLGGYAEGWLVVTPGQVLNVFVGGQGATPTGGFNGGANGGSTNAGGGGGASDVRVGGTAEANRVITAGGGGGGGRAGCETANAGVGGTGGSGGGGVGANGGDSPTSGGVAGGGQGGNFGSVQGALGAAGAGCGGFLGTAGVTATTGTGGSGGAGQSCCCFSFGSIPGGGGGGGGQLGGGGGGGGSAGTTGCSGNDKGAGGGGGGGSSYTGGVLSGATNSGIWLGNGQVSISW